MARSCPICTKSFGDAELLELTVHVMKCTKEAQFFAASGAAMRKNKLTTMADKVAEKNNKASGGKGGRSKGGRR